MTEIESYIIRQQRRKDARLQGRSIEQMGGLTISPEREHILRELPICENFRQPLQDPATGQAYFMADVDALDGGAPLQ